MRIKIRNGVLEHVSFGRRCIETENILIFGISGNFSLDSTDSNVKTAISRSVVYMMENEWPHNWPELFPQFQQVVVDPKLFSQCQMVFIILRRLIEDVITIATVIETSRRKDLATAINQNMSEILKMTIARIRICFAENNRKLFPN